MPKLQKNLNLFGLTMIAIGSCIGSGIFLTPYTIANDLPSEGHMMLMWFVGGLISLTGALTFAELAGMFPKTGGVYHYLKEAYGDLVAFLYGWCILLVITSGAIAALSVAFANYVLQDPDAGYWPKMGVGMLCILAITLANIFGVRISQMFSNFFTVTKILGIIALVVVAASLGVRTFESTIELRSVEDMGDAFSLALIGILWSYGGWHHASYLAGESKNATKIIPKAMLLGTLAVTIIYMACNWAYLTLIPLEAIQENQAVAAVAVGAVVDWGGPVIAALIAISVFGTASIYTLTAPRIYYRMAKDGVFFDIFSKISEKYKVPVWAIVLQSAWAVVLMLFWGLFSKIIGYVVFTDWLFMLLAGFSIFLFRRTRKNHPRPIKAWGYPIIPAIFIGIVGWFIGMTLLQGMDYTLAGCVLIGIGIPVYYLFRSTRKQVDNKILEDNEH